MFRFQTVGFLSAPTIKFETEKVAEKSCENEERFYSKDWIGSRTDQYSLSIHLFTYKPILAVPTSKGRKARQKDLCDHRWLGFEFFLRIWKQMRYK